MKLMQISNEFILQRFKNGMRIMPPGNEVPCLLMMQSVNQLAMNMYLNNTNHELLYANEAMLNCVGHSSLKCALGKTVEAVGANKRENAIVMRNNHIVMQAEQAQFFDETSDLLIDKTITPISLKMPCYDENNNLIGIFGASVMANENIAQFASQVAFITSLLNINTAYANPIKNNCINGVHFTNREMDIIRLVVRGRSMTDIGVALNLSKRTVQNYFETMKLKAGAKSKLEFIDMVMSYFFIAI